MLVTLLVGEDNRLKLFSSFVIIYLHINHFGSKAIYTVRFLMHSLGTTVFKIILLGGISPDLHWHLQFYGSVVAKL